MNNFQSPRLPDQLFKKFRVPLFGTSPSRAKNPVIPGRPVESRLVEISFCDTKMFPKVIRNSSITPMIQAAFWLESLKNLHDSADLLISRHPPSFRIESLVVKGFSSELERVKTRRIKMPELKLLQSEQFEFNPGWRIRRTVIDSPLTFCIYKHEAGLAATAWQRDRVTSF